MIDLRERSQEEEIMDDFSKSGEVIDTTLKELDKINTLLGGNQVSVSGLKKLLKKSQDKKLLIADLGCGSGDLMIQLSRWGRKRGLDLEFVGIDANPAIVEYAQKYTSSHSNIRFENLNIFSDEFKKMKFDVVHCSLFAHHFTQHQLRDLFEQLMSQVRLGVVVNDLHRHLVSYYFTKWIIRGLSRSEMVRYDSVVSVARSFKRTELKSIMNDANVTNYSLKWKWAFRWELVAFFEKIRESNRMTDQ